MQAEQAGQVIGSRGAQGLTMRRRVSARKRCAESSSTVHSAHDLPGLYQEQDASELTWSILRAAGWQSRTALCAL